MPTNMLERLWRVGEGGGRRFILRPPVSASPHPSQVYSGFHSLLSSTWNLFFSLIFLFSVNAMDPAVVEWYGVAFAVAMPLYISFGFYRARGEWQLVKRSMASDVELTSRLTFTIGSRNFIKTSNREQVEEES